MAAFGQSQSGPAGGWQALGEALQTATALLPCPWIVAIEAYVPHAWLLPRCSVILHAASAGAVAAAMQAGIPQLACPLHFDQFFWVRSSPLFVKDLPIRSWPAAICSAS